MAHARKSPSDKIWPQCPGYLNLKDKLIKEGKYQEEPPGVASIEGTGVHLLIEMCLLQGKQPVDFKGERIGVGHEDKPQGWTVTDVRIDRAEYMLAYLHRHRNKNIEAESTSNPGEKFGIDDWYGTADVTITDDDYLEISDYKNGRTFVKADIDNSQLIAYAYGKWNGESNVRLSIVQPQTKPAIRYIDITGIELEEKAKELAEKAKATDDPDAPLIAGDWCTNDWCKLRNQCPEHNKKTTDIIDDEVVETFFNNLIVDLPTMSNGRLSKLMDAKVSMTKLFEKLEVEMQLRLESGTKLNGYAMKPSRGSREWSNEKDLILFLKKNKIKKADYTKTELLSPAQLEKKVSCPLDDFIVKKEGKLKLTKVNTVKF